METWLMSAISAPPDEQELMTLLGKNTYKHYTILCDAILLFLVPDIEIWCHGGRRGKYFHGYRRKKPLASVDLFLDSGCYLNCEFELTKRRFEPILKKRAVFGEKVQKTIDSYIGPGGEYGCAVIDLRIDDETLQEAIKMIKMLAYRKRVKEIMERGEWQGP
jgi:hypothetical protein